MDVVLLSLLLLVPLRVEAAAAADSAAKKALPTWTTAEKELLLQCQAPLDLRVQPETRKIGESTFVLQGSRVTLLKPTKQQIVVGVLSAIKEVEPETQENIARAAKIFAGQGVDIIVANGDVALNQFDLEEAMQMLGQTGLPVFVQIGNSEGRGGFNRAFVAAEKKYPNLFNLNWVRQVDLGSIHLLSLPGYYDRAFMPQSSGCRYSKGDLFELAELADKLHKESKTAVLVSHGPPKSKGKHGIDLAFEAGNVGDPQMQSLLLDHQIRYGIFGHILEAGGRGNCDLRLGKRAQPKRKYPTLYVNAGSASATPWGMLNGKSSSGMALIVRIDSKQASYQTITLRP